MDYNVRRRPPKADLYEYGGCSDTSKNELEGLKTENGPKFFIVKKRAKEYTRCELRILNEQLIDADLILF